MKTFVNIARITRIAAVASLVLVAFGLSSTTAFAQKGGAAPAGGVRIGVVDTRKIIEQLPEYKESEDKLRETGTKFKDTLDTIQKDFLAALEAFQKQESMMSAEAKTKGQENLKAIQDRYQKYRDEKLNVQDPRSELGRMQAELMEPLVKRVRGAIKDVAKDERLSAVMESPAFIYFDESMDITFRVIDKIKRNK
jgi:outer membrane protein